MSTRVTQSPIHQRPHRALAIEAGIIAALARGSASAYEIGRFVQMHLPWASRVEISEARDRMIIAGRVRAIPVEGRAMSLFALPETPAHAPHAPAPTAAPRDIALVLPA